MGLDALHIGCGNVYKDGFVNVDVGDCRVDVEHDLNDVPYPFEADRFRLVLANHVLEHLDKDRWMSIISELYRISAPNAMWEFRSPYGLSDNFVTDPTHRMALSPRSFDYFDPTRPHGKLGAIYGIDAELRVRDGRLIRGDRYGEDVYHRLQVIKPGAPLVDSPALPSYLYTDESELRVIVRNSLANRPRGRRLLTRIRRVTGAEGG
jgi:hypothetical protein